MNRSVIISRIFFKWEYFFRFSTLWVVIQQKVHWKHLETIFTFSFIESHFSHSVLFDVKFFYSFFPWTQSENFRDFTWNHSLTNFKLSLCAPILYLLLRKWRFFSCLTFFSWNCTNVLVKGSWQGSFTHIMRIFHSVREFLVAKCCFRSIVMYRDGKMVQSSNFGQYLQKFFKISILVKYARWSHFLTYLFWITDFKLCQSLGSSSNFP